MKIIAYEVRGDEGKYFEEIAEKLKVEIIYCKEALNDENIELANGCMGVTILGHSNIDSLMLDR